MERDFEEELTMENMTISTHTLTWSVTSYDIVYNGVTVISTHTLTWSVTVVSG